MSQAAPVQPGNPVQPPRRRRILRVLAFAGAAFLGLIVLVTGCAVVMTRDVTAAGNQFLADVTGPDPALAWRSAGPDLRRALNEEAFVRWVRDHHLQGGTVGFWGARSRNNADGSLQGTMTLSDGSTTPLRLILRQNAAGLWQVIGVKIGDHGETRRGADT